MVNEPLKSNSTLLSSIRLKSQGPITHSLEWLKIRHTIQSGDKDMRQLKPLYSHSSIK